MTAKVTFFPVDNGDMTLIRLTDPDTTSLLIDCKIRSSADDPDNPTPNVSKALRERIQTDPKGRPYVDAMLLSHPDEDHCLGLEKHFWLGPIANYPDDSKPQDEKRIIIREMWSSPMVFRRAKSRAQTKGLTLCSDAKAFHAEARRRVRVNEDNAFSAVEGDRILILGEDEGGKTKDLGPILVKPGDVKQGVNSSATSYLTCLLYTSPSPRDKRQSRMPSSA